MAFLVIAGVAYLAGAASAVFLTVVIGIRRGDRPERIAEGGFSSSGACTRRILNSGTWPDVPVYRPGNAGNRSGRPEFPGSPR